MKNTRVAGHELPNEGRIYVPGTWDFRSGVAGPAVCSCGKKSESLPNASQRKKWHREHKEQVKS